MPDQDSCSAILLDSYSDGSYGGTGKRIEVELARGAMAEAVRPVIVAGGLTPENVGEVIRDLRPFAVDVSSGVEDQPGIKNSDRLRALFQAVAEQDQID